MLFGVHGLLLSLAATTGIHIGETDHVPYQDALSLVETMAGLIEERTERPVVVDASEWEQCRGRGPCLDAVRARTRAEDVVIVRVIAGPLTLHVASERFYFDVAATRTSSASLPKNERESWRPRLEKMVVRLFPELPEVAPPPPSPPPPLVQVATEPPPEPSIAPWVVLGVSGAVAAVGTGFGVSNYVAKNQLEGQVVLIDERADLEGRVRSHGITATVLFSAAAAGAITAVLLYVFD
jgi:hypothetical protein